MTTVMQGVRVISGGSLSNAVFAKQRRFAPSFAKPASSTNQFLSGSALKRSPVLQKPHACRNVHRVSASAIEGPSTGTAGSGQEYKSTPKEAGSVSGSSHSGYQNPPKSPAGSVSTGTSKASDQKHTGYHEGEPVKVPADSEQKHAGYENKAEEDNAEEGGAQAHAGYKEGDVKDPQGGEVSQSHAGYENPPEKAGGASKQGHSNYQALGSRFSPIPSDVLGLSGGSRPAGSRVGVNGVSKAGGSSGGGRRGIVMRAAGAAVASSGQKQSHAIKAPATVFVAGATGATGQMIVKALLARGLRVKAGVRNVNSAREKIGPPSTDKKEHLELVETNFTSGVNALAEAIKGSDAVVSALGARPSFNFKQPWEIDCQANIDLADACQKAGVKKLVVVSALLTNGAELGQVLNPTYIILNVFGLTLVAKHRAEQYIWKTGLDYTIVRPGGLDRGEAGNIVLGKEDTIFGGAVPREQVAEVAAEALLLPEASYKVVEVISKKDAPAKKLKDLFAAVPSVPH